MAIDYKSVSEVEQSLLRDHLRKVDPKDEVATRRAIKLAHRQAPAVQILLPDTVKSATGCFYRSRRQHLHIKRINYRLTID